MKQLKNLIEEIENLGENRKERNMDVKRISSAILGLPMVIVVLLFGNKYIIDIALSIVAIISLHEYFNAFKQYKPIKWVGYLSAIVIAFLHIIPQEELTKIISLGIPVILAILFIQLIIENMKISIIDIAITLFGICYIVLFTAFIPILAGAMDGKILIWYVLIIAWGTDIFAYLIGKRFGKHKFSKISPNKSIEGCIAGIVGAVALSLLYTYCMRQFVGIYIESYLFITIMSIVLSIVGQFGDFAASSIKRYVGIKDFSNLIPGHGGLLDRIDSLIFIAPFAYIILIII